MREAVAIVPAWEMAVLLALVGAYSLLALFRAAQHELPRLRLGSVLREAGRQGGLLERWVAGDHRILLMSGVQVAFQAILVLTTLLVADMINRALPGWGLAARLSLAFVGTVGVLVILIRLLVVRALVTSFPEATVRVGGHVAAAAAVTLLPLLVPLDRIIRALPSRMGAEPPERSEASLEEEVHAFVSMGEEEGILEKEEGDLVRNVVDFGDTIVREIMTPRTDMVVLDRSARLGEVRTAFIEAKHSRIPIQRRHVDHIEGALTIKDLLPIWSEPDDTPVEDLIRPVLFVPETKKVLDLLREMQQSKVPFAMVVDEYGGTAGLVTVEDIVEEIVGDIQDEHEHAEQEIVEESPGTWLVSGLTHVEEVEDFLGWERNGTDVDTVGGMVTALLGRVPEVGETLEHGGAHLEVLAADGRRVLKLRISRARSRAAVEGKNG